MRGEEDSRAHPPDGPTREVFISWLRGIPGLMAHPLRVCRIRIHVVYRVLVTFFSSLLNGPTVGTRYNKRRNMIYLPVNDTYPCPTPAFQRARKVVLVAKRPQKIAGRCCTTTHPPFVHKRHTFMGRTILCCTQSKPCQISLLRN